MLCRIWSFQVREGEVGFVVFLPSWRCSQEMSWWVALPLHQKKMPLQISVLRDEKGTALSQAASESLSLLLCGGRGRHDAQQPCCAIRWTLAVKENWVGNLRRQLGCQPSSLGLDCSSESCKFDDSWRYLVKVKLLLNFSQTSELWPCSVFSPSRLFSLVSYLYVFPSSLCHVIYYHAFLFQYFSFTCHCPFLYLEVPQIVYYLLALFCFFSKSGNCCILLKFT